MSILSYLKGHAVLAGTVVVIVVVGMVIAGRVASRQVATDSLDTSGKKVVLVDVSDFRDNTSSVSADGTVESVSQVDVKSQVSAPLATVAVSIGSNVTAGQTIATLQNADIRAQLDQARATLLLAQGQYSGSGVSLDSARRAVIDKVRDAYAKIDDIVHVQLDPFLFINGDSGPKLSTYTSDYEKIDEITSIRIDLNSVLPKWLTGISKLSSSSSDDDLRAALVEAQKNIDIVSGLLDNVSLALIDISRTMSGSSLAIVNGWQATTITARNTVSGLSSGITTMSGTFSNALVSQDSTASAQVSAAEAGVKNLEAQIAKTVISSPINGKIAALPLRVGELTSPGQLIATVVGGGGLNIKAFVSGEDLSQVAVGAKVLIQGVTAGYVASVAPSVNQTNKKVEIKIAVTDPQQSGLVVGQNVTVAIEAKKPAVSDVSTAASTKNSYILPIQNVKIIPGDAYVFTVNEESKIVKHPVVLGKVSGGFVEITGGITEGMKIVSPVYELEEGDVVVVH
ncbi:MAG: hypothetical protein RIT04_515 [Candidatus Parcubacteria bacterium]|jgi:multidrug efflux pump subunit AcrA (membrane-fusion protein)